MIKSIRLPLRTPFGHEQVMIDGLDRVCFFFGPNGSGKTTISQLIADESSLPDSSAIQWDGGNPVRVYVYNRNFITANFANKASVPGVFTMGKGMVDAQKKIDELTEAIERDKSKKEAAQGNLEQAKAELQAAQTQIVEACWSTKNAIPTELQKQMPGHNTKARFKDGLLEHVAAVKDDDAKPDMAEIEKRAAIIFDDTVTTASGLPQIDFQRLISCEDADIFGKAIVGKEDIPIAALITRLGISDWVEQGQKHIEGDVCPFCQEHTITDKLKADFKSFFDETYQTDKDDLKAAAQRYADEADGIIAVLKGIVTTHADFLDIPSLEARIAELDSNVKGNNALLHQKQNEPSRTVTLVSAKGICDAIQQLLDNAATAISNHNDMIQHRAEQKADVVADLWRYAAITARPSVIPLQKNETTANNKITGLTNSISKIDDRIRQNMEELRKAETSLTNVKETADAINVLLGRFGFTSFKIAVAEDDKSYRIERKDGTPVEDTLSEGEASFLTFLYFYHLMNGSLESSGTTDRRVVVIDDPITSMDADVLFVTSSLVRQLAKEARNGNGNTEQLIVLTHNITFHREVTYVRKKEGNSETSYYLIRKSGDHSVVEHCEKNPVISTYELLWKDFLREDCNPLTAQNIARRITETFFKLIGDPDLDGVITGMASPDREIARSYLAWANAGSHSPFDDETFQNTGESIDVYRRVLKTIFESAGYIRHYEDMIGRYAVMAP